MEQTPRTKGQMFFYGKMTHCTPKVAQNEVLCTHFCQILYLTLWGTRVLFSNNAERYIIAYKLKKRQIWSPCLTATFFAGSEILSPFLVYPRFEWGGGRTDFCICSIRFYIYYRRKHKYIHTYIHTYVHTYGTLSEN
jgi:hypothetical protein